MYSSEEHRHKEIVRLLQRIDEQLHRLLNHFRKEENRVARFVIVQEGDTMADKISGVAPGSTGTFQSTPLNAAGEPVDLPLSTVPVWTSSDSVNAPVVASADGLSATVSVPSAFVPADGATFTLTEMMADGTAASTKVVSFTHTTTKDNVVASFGIEQVS